MLAYNINCDISCSQLSCSIAYRFQLVPNTQKGQVYAPLMTVSYSDILITDPAKQTVAVGICKVYIKDIYMSIQY